MKARTASGPAAADRTPLVEPVPSAPSAMIDLATDGEETPPACMSRTSGKPTAERVVGRGDPVPARLARRSLPMRAGGSSRIAVGANSASCSASVVVSAHRMVWRPVGCARSTAAANRSGDNGLLVVVEHDAGRSGVGQRLSGDPTQARAGRVRVHGLREDQHADPEVVDRRHHGGRHGQDDADAVLLSGLAGVSGQLLQFVAPQQILRTDLEERGNVKSVMSRSVRGGRSPSQAGWSRDRLRWSTRD